MHNFKGSHNHTLNEVRLHLNTRVYSVINFYKSFSYAPVKEVVSSPSGNAPGVDSFLDSFVKNIQTTRNFVAVLLSVFAKCTSWSGHGWELSSFASASLNFLPNTKFVLCYVNHFSRRFRIRSEPYIFFLKGKSYDFFSRTSRLERISRLRVKTYSIIRNKSLTRKAVRCTHKALRAHKSLTRKSRTITSAISRSTRK